MDNLEFTSECTGSELNKGKHFKCFHWPNAALSKMENLCANHKRCLKCGNRFVIIHLSHNRCLLQLLLFHLTRYKVVSSRTNSWNDANCYWINVC